jgi:anthranilate synthase component 2
MRILILDNYDSFTYNLAHYVEQLIDGSDVLEVKRNDSISVEEAQTYDNIILSPGPGLPDESGIMPALLGNHGTHLPILGICLGHQAIAESHGAILNVMESPLHGLEVNTSILNQNNPLFRGIDSTITTGHYHSWIVSSSNFPLELNIDAIGPNGEIMALSHSELPRYGIQFHPESVMTPSGLKIIANWIGFCRNHTN